MIGVLGLQGDYEAHVRMLKRAGVQAQLVKKPGQLATSEALVIPGGESTTLLKLMDRYGFWQPLHTFAQTGKAIMGTCAGMILLAREVLHPSQKSLDLIDLTVERNSYGHQRESFEGIGVLTLDGKDQPLPMVFIRAPRICRLGPGVESLATCQGECVMARQNRILVAAFHPELTDDLTVHRYFLAMAGRGG